MTVFDPFMGSGSTGVACTNTNRNFIGIEKDDQWFEVAQIRVQSATRESPEYQGDKNEENRENKTVQEGSETT